jgi:hypothetical protein
LDADPVFSRFLERRERLLNHLDSSRVQFDDWIERHRTLSASIADLAHFEGLLAERRNALDELLKLDDSLLDHLVVLLGRSSSQAGSP